MDCFHNYEFTIDQSYFKFANKSYLSFANEMGWIAKKRSDCSSNL